MALLWINDFEENVVWSICSLDENVVWWNTVFIKLLWWKCFDQIDLTAGHRNNAEIAKYTRWYKTTLVRANFFAICSSWLFLPIVLSLVAIPFMDPVTFRAYSFSRSVSSAFFFYFIFQSSFEIISSRFFRFRYFRSHVLLLHNFAPRVVRALLFAQLPVFRLIFSIIPSLQLCFFRGYYETPERIVMENYFSFR